MNVKPVDAAGVQSAGERMLGASTHLTARQAAVQAQAVLCV